MKKAFHKIHLWLSVPFGLIITVICFSGAALVFENEITELCRHDLYYVKQTEGSPLPIDRLLVKVAETLPDSISITGIGVFADPQRAYQVSLSKPRRASILVDPYTGKIKGKSERMPFFMTMFKLHRWLLDSMKPDGGIFWGKMIVGTATLMLVFVLISGIVIWYPRTRKALKNSLRIATDRGWKRFWYDLHVAGGMYTLILLLAMALTGLTWSFEWYRTGFYKVFGTEIQPEGGQGNNDKGKEADKRIHGSSKERHESPFAHWQEVYEQLKEQNAEFKQITVSDKSASVSFDRLGNQRAADRYAFNPRNGEITETALYQDADRTSKIRGWIFSVHVGSWGGMPTRILTFIAALVGGSLPLTGYYLWIRRLYRKNNRRKS